MNHAALITGGSKRIGRSIALHLASKGFDIALHYHRSKRDAQKTAWEIIKKGVRCETFCVDLSNAKKPAALLSAAKKEFPHLDVLVNNASVFKPASVKEPNLQELGSHFKINFMAPYALSYAFAKASRTGQIINLLDAHIVKNKTSYGAYLLTKKALADLTKITALDFAPNIRVNAVAPGLILPPKNKDKGYLDRLAKNIPLKRHGDVSHVLRAVQFLLENDFVSGQIIFVDGGEHLK